MSDNWIILIPADPRLVPPQDRQQLALKRLAELLPEAEECEVQVTERVQFIDCGENFGEIKCPHCGQDITTSDWVQRMDADFDGQGSRLEQHTFPCCGAKMRLNQLRYDFHVGFSRFSISAMNPNVAEFTAAQLAEMEQCLGTPLQVIYQHI